MLDNGLVFSAQTQEKTTLRVYRIDQIKWYHTVYLTVTLAILK